MNNAKNISGFKNHWLAGAAILPLAAIIVLSVSWSGGIQAQELPQPMSITEPTPDPAASALPAPVLPVADPSTGLPSAPIATDSANTADAQSASGTYETLDPAAFANLETAMKSMAVLRKDVTKPEDVGTLVFTLWQHSLLQDAKRLFRTRRPTDAEIAAAADGSAVEQARPRGIREISLSGILFKGEGNWIVWLNGKRMAPDALPKEVIDIKVAESHVDLRWFDAYTNLIYPIRIRPHQRFNLDTRIFLPGITADAAAQLQAASTGN